MPETYVPQIGDLRPSSVFLHIGAKKTGKTQGTLNMIVDMWKRQRKPCIVFDIGGQSEYDDFIPLALDDLEFFNAMADQEPFPLYRVRSLDDFDEFFLGIVEWVRNAFVVFEDATSYMVGNLPESHRRLLLGSRNHCNDYLFNLHSLAEPAPFLFRHAEYIILRRTSDVKLPSKVPVPHKIEKAMREIDAENRTLYPDPQMPKLAFRLIDITAA
nr:hypothetical protein [uncultured Arsenicibacter sp.]